MGSLRRADRGAQPAARTGRVADEPALAAHRHRDGRPGDVCHACCVRGGRRVSRARTDGGRRAEPAPQAPVAAALSPRPRRHFGPALGVARRRADDRAHVVAAARLLPRCLARAPAPDVLRLTPILVFAKAPVPGEVKTRLIPALGAAGAAALHARLVARTLATAAAAEVGPVELCCAPDATHPQLVELARAHGATLAAPGPGALGARMHAAFERVRTRAPAAIVIGSDCPPLAPEHLRDAARAFDAGYDATIAPAEDGGYVLIGLTHPAATLFERIEWGGPNVMAETRERLVALGLRWRELATLWDVDRPEDLGRLERLIAAQAGGDGRQGEAMRNGPGGTPAA